MVGCVIVHNHTLLSSGFHTRFGASHAEVEAINNSPPDAPLDESTLYVTLEPCNHRGKTPPCTELIIQSKIPKVVIASVDPNPLVAGSGIARLKEAGISVSQGVLSSSEQELNHRFHTFHTRKRPYIVLKWAQTRDGFVAREDFSSRWISGEGSRSLVHRWRGEEQSILVGTTTALMDNPRLTVRNGSGENPLRLVFDRELRIPLSSNLFSDSDPTWCFYSPALSPPSLSSQKRFISLQSFLDSPPVYSFVLKEFLQTLHQENIISVFVEGGTRLLSSFLDEGLWDEARVFEAPVSFGSGIQAPSMSGEAFRTEEISRQEKENDILRYYKNPGEDL